MTGTGTTSMVPTQVRGVLAWDLGCADVMPRG